MDIAKKDRAEHDKVLCTCKIRFTDQVRYLVYPEKRFLQYTLGSYRISSAQYNERMIG